MSKIILENMEFHAFHGCMEHEKKLGNTFLFPSHETRHQKGRAK